MTSIVDAHVHLLDPGRFSYGWTTDRPTLQGVLDAPVFASHADPRVESVVLVEADCDLGQAIAEAGWLATQDAVDVLAVVAAVDLADPEFEGRTELLAGIPRVTAVRQILDPLPDDRLLDPRTLAGIARAGEFGLVFDVCAASRQGPRVLDIATRLPGTRLVLDHLGKPDVGAGEWETWTAWFDALARAENVVAVKLSGLFDQLGPDGRHRDVLPYLDHALQTWGPDRLMIGSDWPVLAERGSHADWIDLVVEAIGGGTAREQESVLSGTANRVYGGH